MTDITITESSGSKVGLWIGRIMSGLVVLFMVFDSTIKLLDLQIVQDSMKQLGYPTSLGQPIGIIEAVIVVLYVYPRTSVLAAVLLTGVYGGAIATHLRVSDPLFSHVLFGVYLGLLAWGGLYLRDARLRSLFPIRR